MGIEWLLQCGAARHMTMAAAACLADPVTNPLDVRYHEKVVVLLIEITVFISPFIAKFTTPRGARLTGQTCICSAWPAE
jgi:hypothetical protein